MTVRSQAGPSTYPNVYVVRDLVDADTVKFLCGETQEERLVISGNPRARECRRSLAASPTDEGSGVKRFRPGCDRGSSASG